MRVYMCACVHVLCVLFGGQEEGKAEGAMAAFQVGLPSTIALRPWQQVMMDVVSRPAAGQINWLYDNQEVSP